MNKLKSNIFFAISIIVLLRSISVLIGAVTAIQDEQNQTRKGQKEIERRDKANKIPPYCDKLQVSAQYPPGR